MPNITYPNQRLVKIHREKATSNFLGIKNENWQAAARDLGAHSTLLYLYLAANADGYTDALSPRAIQQAIGMPRSTYHDQFQKLVLKGYLVPASGNTYDFYEVPKLGRNGSSSGGVAQEKPRDDAQEVRPAPIVGSQDIEINNIQPGKNSGINNDKLDIQIPKVKEVVIQRLKRQSKVPGLSEEEFEF